MWVGAGGGRGYLKALRGHVGGCRGSRGYLKAVRGHVGGCRTPLNLLCGKEFPADERVRTMITKQTKTNKTQM